MASHTILFVVRIIFYPNVSFSQWAKVFSWMVDILQHRVPSLIPTLWRLTLEQATRQYGPVCDLHKLGWTPFNNYTIARNLLNGED